MKKVLLPVEGRHYPQELLDFIAKVNPVGPVLLTAAFVPHTDYANALSAGDAAGMVGLPTYEQEVSRVHFNKRKMENFSREHDILLKIHVDENDFALTCLRKESRFADLLLLSGKHFFESLEERQPNVWMKELLHRSECPLLVLPDNAGLPGELILAYDGSAESVFAIKQFAYLFPEFKGLKATLVYVNDDPEARIPDEEAIKDLGVQYYKKLRLVKTQMRSEDFYGTWLGMLKNPWLITGSYGRSALSEVFHGSFSAELIRRHEVPVFVAHR